MNRSETPADDGRRFNLLTEATMTSRQREAYEGIVSGPRKGAVGPFNALLRSPDVAAVVSRSLGAIHSVCLPVRVGARGVRDNSPTA